VRKPVAIILSVSGALALVWVVGVALVAGEALLGVASSESVADITVENRSAEPIMSGEIEFLGDKHSFSNIGIGDTARVSFRIRGEGGYRIHVLLASGKEVETPESTYLTTGFPSDTRIVDAAEVTNDRITVRRLAVGLLTTAR